MTKPVTGQYECVHRSGVGIDYFTSRIDRLTLQANGRFVLAVQDRSRIANAAQSLVSGQQANMAAPETRREGNYTCQGNVLFLHFDDGKQEQGQFSWNGEGVQIGTNFFNKVSDSTLLPPTHRIKKDMEDIAKGLKIAGAIGGAAIKAAKTIHDTLQTTQGTEPGQQQQPSSPPPAPVPSAQAGTPPASSGSPAPVPPQNRVVQTPPPVPPVQPAPPVQSASSAPQQGGETLFCDQCGAPARPGKRFCNVCGARLPE
jgi:hypothetical protein